MWPWGHLAVGYLSYVLVCRFTERGPQTAVGVVAVVLGSQFPDLVDKPLAWSFAVLPSGRSLAHSLLVAAVIIAVGYRLLARYDFESAWGAFAIGYVSHCLTDIGPTTAFALLQGDVSQLQWLTYLVWPVFPPPPYQHDASFIAHFAAFEFTTYVLVQFALFGIAVGVWAGTGFPGLDAVRRGHRRGREQLK